jgi:hypothetical protein
MDSTATQEMMQQMMRMYAIMGPIYLIIGLAFHVLFAIPMMKIGNRMGLTGWFAWVPILNFVLILQIAKKPVWWIAIIFLLSACVVGLVFMILALIAFFKEINKSPYWTFAILFSPLLLIPIWQAAKEG